MQTQIEKKRKKLNEVCSSQSSENGGRNFIHLVSIDGPNPFKQSKKKIEPKIESEPEKVKDYSKTEAPINEDFFKINEKDKAINNILEPKKAVKYFPPKKLPNPFEEHQI